jgi:hypothetical protein
MYIVLKFNIVSFVLLFWTDGNLCFTSRLPFHPKLLSTPSFLTEIRRHFDVNFMLEFSITYPLIEKSLLIQD